MRLNSSSIRLQSCGKTFPDGTRALHPLDLHIEAGESIAIVGPSGCGKTTLLRIIAGLETPDVGARVIFGDKDVTKLPIEKRNVGMVFQSYALFPNMSVIDNVGYGLRVRGISLRERREQAMEMLEMVQITELAQRHIDQLSGGQRQRVALARAIAVRPQVLLLDEPLTALDAKLRDAVRLEIDRLIRELRITSIYVTHDQDEAMAIGDRMIVMSNGNVEQIGSPRDIYFSPATPFVADFIGTMNQLIGIGHSGFIEIGDARLPWDQAARGQVTLSFRPEAVSVVAGSDGHFRGKVISAFFQGDRTRLLVKCAGAEEIIVDASGHQSFHAGDAVHLHLDTAQLLFSTAPSQGMVSQT